MKFIKLFVVIAFLASCSNDSNKKVEIKQKNSTTTSCYLYALNKDSISLQLKDSNGILTGLLNYLPYEKDGTIGNLYDLKFMGDTLIGMYKSEQEGIQSVGEMALLKLGNKFILTNENEGGSNYKWDSSYNNGRFIDKSKITFSGDTLQAINCN